jgi:hypothetical protein
VGGAAVGAATGNEYNQRESDNLMNIVAVVYGVALTTAFSSHPDLLIHPLSAQYLIPSMALLAAALLTAFSFFGYVLAIGGDTPYKIAWNTGSSNGFGVIRFLADLVLASLYVRLLFAAADVESGRNAKPKLAELAFAFVLVFAGAIAVRLIRNRKINWISLIAVVVSSALWAWSRSSVATRRSDLFFEVILLAVVLLYAWLNHVFSYRAWKRDQPSSLIQPECNAKRSPGTA